MNRLILTIITILCTAQAGFCVPPAMRDVIVKFSLAMGGVLLSSFLIFLGLTIYNKCRSNNDVELTPEEEVLRTPKTIDQAVKFYIRKNRLK